MMNVFQPLPVEEWRLLQELFKRDWPIYAQYYYWIETAIKWNKKDPNYAQKIYCPNGKYNYGVFIRIDTATEYHVVIASFDENRDLLKKALIESNLIDWNRTVLFPLLRDYVKGAFLEAFDYLSKLKGLHISDVDDTYYYFKSKEECAKATIQVPEECELRHLDRSHVPLIHSLWAHKSKDQPESTVKFLELLLEFNRGVGLFLKKDNALTSWILENDCGIGILQTVEEHKRKGYGKIITEAIAKETAVEENLDSVTFIVKGNIPSEKLFTSLGYIRYTTATWFKVEKNQ